MSEIVSKNSGPRQFHLNINKRAHWQFETLESNGKCFRNEDSILDPPANDKEHDSNSFDFACHRRHCIGSDNSADCGNHYLDEKCTACRIKRCRCAQGSVASSRKRALDPAWEAHAGFVPEGAFKVLGVSLDMQMIIWSQQDQANYLCVNLNEGAPTTVEFVTIWENGALTTGSVRDGHAMPKRESRWLQTFNEKDAAALWQHHEKAFDYLTIMHPELRKKTPDKKTTLRIL